MQTCAPKNSTDVDGGLSGVSRCADMGARTPSASAEFATSSHSTAVLPIFGVVGCAGQKQLKIK